MHNHRATELHVKIEIQIAEGLWFELLLLLFMFFDIIFHIYECCSEYKRRKQRLRQVDVWKEGYPWS